MALNKNFVISLAKMVFGRTMPLKISQDNLRTFSRCGIIHHILSIVKFAN